MSHLGTGALRSHGLADGSRVLADASCGSCAACAAGCSLWCTAPVVEGRPFGVPFPHSAATALEQAALGAAALREVRPTGAVVTSGPHACAAAVMARTATSAVVLSAADTRDPELRDELERREPSGRAAVIITAGDVRAAVKAVRRGGVVVVTGTDPVMPSITELVQREVTLVTPLDLAHLHDAVPPEVWAAAVAAA